VSEKRTQLLVNQKKRGPQQRKGKTSIDSISAKQSSLVLFDSEEVDEVQFLMSARRIYIYISMCVCVLDYHRSYRLVVGDRSGSRS